MSRRRNSPVKLIHGIEAEEYFSDTIGPMAASVLEMLMTKFIQNKGQGMSGGEMKLVQFGIERAYGTATRQVEVKTITEQEYVTASLEMLDEDTVRKIANLKPIRTIENTVN